MQHLVPWRSRGSPGWSAGRPPRIWDRSTAGSRASASSTDRHQRSRAGRRGRSHPATAGTGAPSRRPGTPSSTRPAIDHGDAAPARRRRRARRPTTAGAICSTAASIWASVSVCAALSSRCSRDGACQSVRERTSSDTGTSRPSTTASGSSHVGLRAIAANVRTGETKAPTSRPKAESGPGEPPAASGVRLRHQGAARSARQRRLECAARGSPPASIAGGRHVGHALDLDALPVEVVGDRRRGTRRSPCDR